MSRARTRAVMATNESAPADALAGANDGGYEGQISVDEEYRAPLTDTSDFVPTVCTRVAIYRDEHGRTVDIMLPPHITPKPMIRRKRRDWTLQASIDLQPGETVNAALERELVRNETKARGLIDDIVGALR